RLQDILGRWCEPRGGRTYIFSNTQLVVTLMGGTRRVLRVYKTEPVDDDTVAIIWTPPKRPDGLANRTEFWLSKDKRELVQPPSATGDRGPRRQFTRC